MAFGAAKLFIHFMIIDDVVAVGASRRGLQIRGAIEMADAKFSQVIGNGRGIGESEAGVQLNAVSSAEVRRHDVAPSQSVTPEGFHPLV